MSIIKKGIVFNVQRYSINDGPGIRTVVFLKGCSMKCLWCENPESIEPKPQLAFYKNKCINCGSCTNVCSEIAIDNAQQVMIKWSRCNNCGKCAKICPAKALNMIGEEMTIEEVLETVIKDLKFYHASNGGVTISGGEATFQYDFLHSLLEALKKDYISCLKPMGCYRGPDLRS